MGWTFSPRSLQAVVDDLLRTREYEDSVERTLHHTVTAERDYYVLWRVVAVTATRDATVYRRALRTGEELRYIRCDLLQKDVNRWGVVEWGYKSLCEVEHPGYYSCPLSYLRKAPVVLCQEWRERVREQHAKWRFRTVNYRLLAAA